MKNSAIPSWTLQKNLATVLRMMVMCVMGIGFLWGGNVGLGQALGPGGIDGGDLLLWARADSGTCGTDNCDIVSWLDQSTAANNGTPAGSGANAPKFQENELNFNPSVQVTGSGYIQFTRNIQDDMSIFLVFRTTQGGGSASWYSAPAILSNQNNFTEDDFGIGMDNGQVFWGHDPSNNRINANAGAYNNNVPHLVTVTRDSTGPVTISMNGLTAISAGGVTGALDDNGNVRAGRSADLTSGNADFAGHYGDIIFYDQVIPNTSVEKINTYLAIKYGITLGHNYRKPDGGFPLYTLTGYPNEVLGIARFDTSLLHQKQSRARQLGTNSLTVYNGLYTTSFPADNSANTDTLINKQALLIGHDGQAATFTGTYSGVPNSIMPRTYQVVNTLDVDTVTLVFNNSVFTGLAPGGNYYLMVSPDANFDNTDSLIRLREVGNGNDWYVQYKFNGSLSNIPTNSYFTLKEGPHVSPGGIGKDLQLWVRADTGLTVGGTVTWSDLSGFDRDMSYSNGASTSLVSGGFNFNNYLSNNPATTNKDFSTGAASMSGRTLIVVGRSVGNNSANDNEEYAGLNGVGLEYTTGGGAGIRHNNGGGDSWTDGERLVQNGRAATAPAPIVNWSIISGLTSTLETGEFFLGTYSTAADRLSDYDFAEAIIYRDEKDLGGTPPLHYIESYLALKYGITLGHHYYGSHQVIIYDTTGYSNDIAGIGRDDCSALYQKQSHSINSDAIVEIGLGLDSLYSTNAANPNTFASDRNFLIWGNDNGDDCWSNSDIYFPLDPTPRDFLRIDREWKYQETSFGAFGPVLVTLDTTANGGFDFPDLPPGTSTYYLFHDDDGDFTNGGTSAPQMNLDTNTGKYYAILPTNGATGYFTFGTKYDTPLAPVSYCPGDTVTFTGSHLASNGLCSQITLTGGPNYVLDNGSGPDFLLIENPADLTNGNCLDVVQWEVPALTQINPGTYATNSETSPPGCAGFVPTNNIRQTSIGVGNPVPADIRWVSDTSVTTIYACLGDPNELITNLDTSAGTFSLDTNVSPLSNINQLMIDTTVLVHSGTIGTHPIIFTATGGGCSSTDTLWISIETLKPSFVSYTTPYNAFPSVCKGLGVYNVDSVKPLGGTFSAFPSSLVIDPTTGDINTVLTPDTGTYSVIYIPPNDSCYAHDTILIRIQGEEQAMFNYPNSGFFCINDSNPIPLITYLPSGPDSGFIAISANAADISINPATGEIDLAASLPGTYDIKYDILTTCKIETIRSVTILNTPSPAFSIPSQVCSNQGTLIPSGINFSTVNYWSEWTGNVDIDSTTGTINLANSAIGGPYPITYHAIANGCLDSVVHPLTIIGVPATNIIYPSPQYCKDDSNPTPIFLSGVGGGTFLSNPPTASLNPSSGILNLATVGAPATYAITYAVPLAACPDTVFIQSITVDSVPDASFTLGTSTVCAGSGSVAILPTVPGTSTSTGVYNAGSLVVGAVSGNAIDISVLTPNTTYEVINEVVTSGSCRDTAVRYLTVLANQVSSFLYPDTICDNVDNPTPQILGNGGGSFWADLQINPSTLVNSATGVINLDSSGNGGHVIYYATAGPCPDTSSFVIQILNGYEAYFEYAEGIVCTNDSILLVDSIATPNLGYFTPDTNSLGLVVDPITGTIDLLNSTVAPGTNTYTVIHVVSDSASCTDIHAREVDIDAFDNLLAINYPQDTFCQSVGAITPAISANTPNPTGTFANSPGITFLNLDSGIVAVNQSGTGSFQIKFTLDGHCSEVVNTTFFIKQDDDSTFAYGSNGAICHSPTDSSLFPNSALGSPGFFSWTSDQTSDTLVFVDPFTGEINVAASQAGVYYVTFTTTGDCPSSNTEILRINDKPKVDTLRAEPGTAVCDSESVLFYLGEAPGGSVSYFLNGIQQVQSSTWTSSSFSEGDSIAVVVENSFGCADTASVIMTITAKPEVRIRQRPSVLTGSDPIQIEVGPNLPNTMIHWHVTTGDSISVDSTDGVTAELNVNGFETLTNNIHLESDFIPDSIIYEFVPESRGCIGDTTYLVIYVNPNEFPIFVPEVFTPDGNGLNDTWKIQWRSDLSPEDYVINVYNASGGQVESMSPIRSDWNGEKLPDGVYWWVLKNVSTGELQLAGGVTIRRR